MLQLERNSLVWPTPAGWDALRTQALQDATTQAIVGHWHGERLPLVVSRQPPGRARDLIALGLPAPLQWNRRRLAFALPAAQLAYSGRFPRLAEAAAHHRWRRAALALEHALGEALGHGTGAVQVYGSYGWQCLTGLRYLREGSDLDLRIAVPDVAAAAAVVDLLAAQRLPCRIDGELVFPDGQAVAWREMAQLFEGEVCQVLSKRLDGIALVGLADLQPCAATAVAA
ncbi:malonate decarboxylase holo-[acyl-carrier-protein] synthase [Rhodoferax koreensis]|uniref:malonate decarboxylase holo-[acyl-carrier-protein] synthase n=1 Tax=Rhodoferax koreensis TaxID=1842727 RepID=UPI0012FFB659|nr:malonate decarboxylase holo-[acyl-carrier-protein] synthase [Rhodoferax koreense]